MVLGTTDSSSDVVRSILGLNSSFDYDYSISNPFNYDSELNIIGVTRPLGSHNLSVETLIITNAELGNDTGSDVLVPYTSSREGLLDPNSNKKVTTKLSMSSIKNSTGKIITSALKQIAGVLYINKNDNVSLESCCV